MTERHRTPTACASHSTRAGFTIVEIIIATGISLTLAVLMISITSGLLVSWNRSRGHLTSSNQVKFVLDQLTTDLESAIFRADGNVWLAATVQADQDYSVAGDTGGGDLARWTWGTGGTPKPGWEDPGDADSSLELTPVLDRLEDYRFGMAGMWLRFFANVTDNSDTDPENASAPRAVGYQIARYRIVNNPASAVRYGLFRSEVRPAGTNSTFVAGYDILSSSYADGSAAGSDVQHPGRIRRPTRELLLGMNVVDFGVRFWVHDGVNLRLVFPADASGVTSDDNRAFVATTSITAVPSSSGSAGVTTRGFPEIAEIFVRVLTDEGAQRIEAMENGTVQGLNWWEVALAHSQVYTRRIKIPAHAN